MNGYLTWQSPLVVELRAEILEIDKRIERYKEAICPINSIMAMGVSSALYQKRIAELIKYRDGLCMIVNDELGNGPKTLLAVIKLDAQKGQDNGSVQE